MEFPKTETSYTHVNTFINEISPLVCNEYLKRRRNKEHLVNPSVVIAQACVESGYNIDAKTLFGIKGSDIELDTTEYIDGKYVEVKAGFEKYPGIACAIVGYYDLMQWDNYADATTPEADTWEKQIEGLCNDIGYPYATSPDYKKTVTDIVKDWNLLRYDEFVDEYEKVTNALTEDEIEKLALAVIRGEYGNGNARREALGDRYEKVQTRVDEMLK